MTSQFPMPSKRQFGWPFRTAIACCLVLTAVIWMISQMEYSTIDNQRHSSKELLAKLSADYSDDERKMYMLSEFGGQLTNDAIEDIVRQNDTRFIPPLIDTFRMIESGAYRRTGITEFFFALDRLGGVKLRGNPGEGELTSTKWIEWLGSRDDIKPPVGYVRWKGRLLGKIDPAYAKIFDDDVKSTIRVEEILYGGAKFDAIKAIEQPNMISPVEATMLALDEPVFGIEINGDARAYPLRYLDRHEMANDIIGGVPVSIAYCTLCGAGIAYDGRADNDHTYTFGSSGLLYRSNKLMFDHQSRMLWNHLTGRPVVGKLAGTELKLQQLPIVTTSWREWQETHPHTRVMVMPADELSRYQIGLPYGQYFESDETMFPIWQRSESLPPKARVFGLNVHDVLMAYPFDVLVEKRVINDVVASKQIALLAMQGSVRVDTRIPVARGQFYDDVTYDAGGEVRAYESDGRTFHSNGDSHVLFDQDGAMWRVTESALVGPQDQKLKRIAGHLAYWFGWYAMFPEAGIYGETTMSKER